MYDIPFEKLMILLIAYGIITIIAIIFLIKLWKEDK